MKHIGTNIKLFREARGFSQEQVAAHLGISRAQLSYFESAARGEVPSISILNKLSDLFCIDLSELLEKDVDLAKINASFAFRSSTLSDSDIKAVSNFHELVKNYVKMQKMINAH